LSPEGLREHAGREPRLARAERSRADDLGHQAASDRARRDHFVRARLEDARVFRTQNRLGPAERALREVLDVQPDQVRAHRLLAVVLEEQGRPEAASIHRDRADVLDPPPGPLPDSPLDGSSKGILVALLDPLEAGPARREESPADPIGALSQRLRVRLPRAHVLRTAPRTVPSIRGWFESLAPPAVLSIRVENARCTETTKDGAFALATLRAVVAAPSEATATEHTVRELRFDPDEERGCVEAAVARALEQVFALPDVHGALVEPRTQQAEWSTAQIRALYPNLGAAIDEEIERGRGQLVSGRVTEAMASFRRAAVIDPDDAQVQAYLSEAEQTLTMLHQLPAVAAARASPHPRAEVALEPQLTPERRRVLERRLAEEKQRRNELMARLKISGAEERVPSSEALALLRPVTLPGPDAAGPRIVRQRTQEPIEARALYGKHGEVQVRFYFEDESSLPILREEDRDGDGRPDRWTGYQGISRHDLWEDGGGTGTPDVRWVFLDGGTDIERIEIDRDFDGHAERVLRYVVGKLTAEENDTDGDGRVDRIETFNELGDVEVLEEDVNGDGQFDIRTRFRDGKLVLREISNPEHVEGQVQRDTRAELPAELPPVSSDRVPN
jgi:Flp pilus assembly protein TadD